MAGIPKAWHPNFNPPSPRTTQQATAPRATTSTGPSRNYVKLAPRAASTAYYNPARIIDRSQIEIVDSIAEARKAAAEQREFSDERGDVSLPIHTGMTKPASEIAPRKPIDFKLLLGAAAAYFFLF